MLYHRQYDFFIHRFASMSLVPTDDSHCHEYVCGSTVAPPTQEVGGGCVLSQLLAPLPPPPGPGGRGLRACRA